MSTSVISVTQPIYCKLLQTPKFHLCGVFIASSLMPQRICSHKPQARCHGSHCQGRAAPQSRALAPFLPNSRAPRKPGAFTSAGQHADIIGSELPWGGSWFLWFPSAVDGEDSHAVDHPYEKPGVRVRSITSTVVFTKLVGCGLPCVKPSPTWLRHDLNQVHIAACYLDRFLLDSLLCTGPDFAKVSVFATGPFWVATDLAIRLDSEPFLRPSWSSKSVTDRRSSR